MTTAQDDEMLRRILATLEHQTATIRNLIETIRIVNDRINLLQRQLDAKEATHEFR